MTNYYEREEFGPSGYTVKRSSAYNVQKSSTFSHFHKNSLDNSSLPPLPGSRLSHHNKTNFITMSGTRRPLNDDYAKPPPLPLPSSKRLSIKEKYALEKEDYSYPSRPLSRRPSITETSTPVLSRRPSVKASYSTNNSYDMPMNRTPRPFSASYAMTPSASLRGSPSRDIVSGIATPGSLSRRNSISRLPWPEPSPMRELPPAPKPRIKHYPLPPPKYTEGMLAVSRRLRNRSASPAPNYSEMELSSRPALIPAAIGRPSPSREMIRMTLCGPPLKQYHYGRYI